MTRALQVEVGEWFGYGAWLGLKSDPFFRFRMLLRILRMNMRGRRY